MHLDATSSPPLPGLLGRPLADLAFPLGVTDREALLSPALAWCISTEHQRIPAFRDRSGAGSSSRVCATREAAANRLGRYKTSTRFGKPRIVSASEALLPRAPCGSASRAWLNQSAFSCQSPNASPGSGGPDRGEREKRLPGSATWLMCATVRDSLSAAALRRSLNLPESNHLDPREPWAGRS